MAITVSVVTIQHVYGPGAEEAEAAAYLVLADGNGTEIQIPIQEFGLIVEKVFADLAEDDDEVTLEPEPELASTGSRRLVVRSSRVDEE